jgi:hypothetical protein
MTGLKQHVGQSMGRVVIGTKVQNNLRINWLGGAVSKILADAGAPLAGPSHPSKIDHGAERQGVLMAHGCSWRTVRLVMVEKQYIGQTNERRLHKQGEVRRNKVGGGGIDWAQSGIKCHVSSPTLFWRSPSRPWAVQQQRRRKKIEGQRRDG